MREDNDMNRIKKFYNEHFKSFSLWLIILAIIIYVLPQFVEFLPIAKLEEHKSLVMFVLVIIHLKFLVDKTESIDEKLARTYNVSDYHEYSTYIIDKIKATTTEQKKARLIEYSTSSIKDILDALDKNEFKVQLLIQHPENAVSQLQKRKIWTAICDFHIYIQNYSKNFEIRCYKNIASLRGRHIGENISIGHYIHYKSRTSTNDEFDSILGHSSPMITFEQYTREGKIVLKFFNKCFDELWNSAEPVKNVCMTCKPEYKKICPIPNMCY